MILSDKSIKELVIEYGLGIINPLNVEDIQPNSVDMHLDDKLQTVDGKIIDISQDNYHLKPNEFILGSTLEKVNIPLDLCGHVDGKSSIGRLGVFIHVSSGFIDSGFRGNITLEIYNASDKEFELSDGMSICQLVLETLTTPVDKAYGSDGLNSHYQDSDGVVRSKYER